jgi:hypothetical protein
MRPTKGGSDFRPNVDCQFRAVTRPIVGALAREVFGSCFARLRCTDIRPVDRFLMALLIRPKVGATRGSLRCSQ